MKKARILSFINILFLVVGLGFLTGLAILKVSASVFGYPVWQPFPRHENRNPIESPALGSKPIKQWGSSVDAWYNDNFAFRTQFVNSYWRFLTDTLKTSVGREVPGKDGWIFRRGGDWAELDDYLGAHELTPTELETWRTLIEGRCVWARAMNNAHYLELFTSVKAQIREEMLPLAIRNHRGVNVSKQFKRYLEETNSFAKDNVIFLDDVLNEAVAQGHEVFYDADHHMNDYGTFLMYQKLNKRIAELWPMLRPEFPEYYGTNPPPDVLSGKKLGCYKKDIRLAVSRPGDRMDYKALLYKGSSRYPYLNVHTRNFGDEFYLSYLSVVMAHDSYMRFSLTSWREPEEAYSTRFPFLSSVKDVQAYLFHIFSPSLLDQLTAKFPPNLFIEQIPECRLHFASNSRAPKPSEQTKNAAAFGRAKEFFSCSMDLPTDDEIYDAPFFDEELYPEEGIIKCGPVEPESDEPKADPYAEDREVALPLPPSLPEGKLRMQLVFRSLYPVPVSTNAFEKVTLESPLFGPSGKHSFMRGPFRPYFTAELDAAALTNATVRIPKGIACSSISVSLALVPSSDE